MSGKDAARLAEVFRLIGDESRLGILMACLDEPVCVSDIAGLTRLSPSLVSHHLRRLRQARLVAASKRGRQVFYAAADAHVRRVIGDMAEHLSEPMGAGMASRRSPARR
jgi:DNA-binding transcriptional ArsR family regulator